MYYDTIQIGIRIKALRKKQGFTQEKLAECLNVTDKHIRNLEQGQYGASLDLLIEMAEFFGVRERLFIQLGNGAVQPPVE